MKTRNPPIVAGGEAAGEVVAIGDKVTNVKVGQHVVYSAFGHGFTEYTLIDCSVLLPIPEACPEAIAIMISGLTA